MINATTGFIGAEDNSETGLSAQTGAQSLLEGFTSKTYPEAGV